MFVTSHNLTTSQLPHPHFRNLSNTEGGYFLSGVGMRRQFMPDSLLDFKNEKTCEAINVYIHHFQYQPYEQQNIPSLFDKLDTHMQNKGERLTQELENNAHLLYLNRYYIGIISFAIIGCSKLLRII